jgi:beta-xylosidase
MFFVSSPELTGAIDNLNVVIGDLPAGIYANPILDSDFPDPAVIRADDGFYYAYATQTLREGQWINVQVARSADLLDWEHVGDALPEKPEWARETQDFWAPSVLYGGSTYGSLSSFRSGRGQ